MMSRFYSQIFKSESVFENHSNLFIYASKHLLIVCSFSSDFRIFWCFMAEKFCFILEMFAVRPRFTVVKDGSRLV